MDASSRWNDWLGAELDAIDVDPAGFGEYITAIVDDDAMDEESKVEIITGILSSATEQEVDGAALVAKMLAFRADMLSMVREGEAARKKQERDAIQQRVEEESRRLAEEAARHREELAAASAEGEGLSRALRDLALGDDDGPALLDEAGNPITELDELEGAAAGLDGGNMNKQWAAEQESQKRAEMRTAAEEKKSKEREQKAEQKKKREEEAKKRAARGGRKPARGRGK